MEETGVKLNLQLFAGEEGAAAPTGDVTGGAGAAISGPSGQMPQSGSQEQPTQFQQMIQGQYKQEYEQAVGQRVQQAIQQRFRNQRDLQKQMDEYSPIMQQLGAKYGLDPADTKGIYAKMTDDLSLYQEEADKRGVSPEVVRDMKRLEARNAQLARENERFTEEGRLQEHWRNLSQQAEALKQQFPGFDLMREMNDPRFVRMTAPGSGMTVENAFWALHGMEIQRGSMQYAAQQAQQNLAASVRAGAARPIENGMGRQNPVNMGLDIAHMDKKTRAAYRQRIKNGETINFRDKI